MQFFKRLFGHGHKHAPTEPDGNEQSDRDRAIARKYWDTQLAADLKRRGVPSNQRTP